MPFLFTFEVLYYILRAPLVEYPTVWLIVHLCGTGIYGAAVICLLIGWWKEHATLLLPYVIVTVFLGLVATCSGSANCYRDRLRGDRPSAEYH